MLPQGDIKNKGDRFQMKNITKKALIFSVILSFAILLSACQPVSTPTALPAKTPTPGIPPQTPTGQAIPINPTPVEMSGNSFTDPIVVIQNYDQLRADFNQKVKTTNWIKNVYQIVYFNNVTKEYRDPEVKEEWYRFDADGKLAEAYNWTSTSTGEIQQEAFFYDGSFYNADNNATPGGENSRPREKNDQVDFTGNFAELLKNGEKQIQEAVTYHGTEVWRFSYEIEEGGIRTSTALYINRETGLIAGKETYEVENDGSLKLVSGIITTDFEIGAEPPTQHFQAILQKAQDQHIGPYAK